MSPNLYCVPGTSDAPTSDGGGGGAGILLWAVAQVVVVLDLSQGEQRVFRGHSNDITALTVSQNLPRAASGSAGAKPSVLVWSTQQGVMETWNEVADINPEADKSRVIALGLGTLHGFVSGLEFSPNDEFLCGVSGDMKHTLCVWSLKNGKLIMTRSVGNENPPQPVETLWAWDESLVTACKDKISFWVLNNGDPTDEEELPHDPRYFHSTPTIAPYMSHPQSSVTSVCAVDAYPDSDEEYMSDEEEIDFPKIATGHELGDILIWRDGAQVFSSFHAHEGDVTALLVEGTTMLSAGIDGRVRKWTLKQIPKGEESKEGAELVEEWNLFALLSTHSEHAVVLGTAFGCDPFVLRVIQLHDELMGHLRVDVDFEVPALNAWPAEMHGFPLGKQSMPRSCAIRDMVKLREGVLCLSTLGGLICTLELATSKVEIVSVSQGLGRLADLDNHPTKAGSFVCVGQDRLLSVFGESGEGSCRTRCLGVNDLPELLPRPTRPSSNEPRSVALSPLLNKPAGTDGGGGGGGAAEHKGTEEEEDEGGGGGAAEYELIHAAVGFDNGHILVVQLHSFEEVVRVRRTNESVEVLRFCPRGKFLAAGTLDKRILVFNVQTKYSLHCVLSGHSSGLQCVDWAMHGHILLSHDASREVIWWKINDRGTWEERGEALRDGSHLGRDESWATQTRLFSFDRMGIWQASDTKTTATRVLCADVVIEDNLIITGDERGKVNLYNYPCVVKGAPGVQHSGHSLFVTSIRSLGLGQVVSAGGSDHALLLWKLVQLPAPEDHENATELDKILAEYKDVWRGDDPWKWQHFCQAEKKKLGVGGLAGAATKQKAVQHVSHAMSNTSLDEYVADATATADAPKELTADFAVCHLCGNDFLLGSMENHLTACVQKFEEAQAGLRPEKRSDLPDRPNVEGLVEISASSAPALIFQYNEQAREIFNGLMMATCPFCGRTFEKAEDRASAIFRDPHNRGVQHMVSALQKHMVACQPQNIGGTLSRSFQVRLPVEFSKANPDNHIPLVPKKLMARVALQILLARPQPLTLRRCDFDTRELAVLDALSGVPTPTQAAVLKLNYPQSQALLFDNDGDFLSVQVWLDKMLGQQSNKAALVSAPGLLNLHTAHVEERVRRQMDRHIHGSHVRMAKQMAGSGSSGGGSLALSSSYQREVSSFLKKRQGHTGRQMQQAGTGTVSKRKPTRATNPPPAADLDSQVAAMSLYFASRMVHAPPTNTTTTARTARRASGQRQPSLPPPQHQQDQDQDPSPSEKDTQAPRQDQDQGQARGHVEFHDQDETQAPLPFPPSVAALLRETQIAGVEVADVE